MASEQPEVVVKPVLQSAPSCRSTGPFRLHSCHQTLVAKRLEDEHQEGRRPESWFRVYPVLASWPWPSLKLSELKRCSQREYRCRCLSWPLLGQAGGGGCGVPAGG